MDNHAELMAAMTNLANTIQASTVMTTHAMWRTRQSAENENGAGAEDSLDDNWFQAVECALQTQHVPNNQFVKYVAYQLVGEAQHWCQEECRFLQLQNMDIPWELFRTIFNKKYFPESVREAKELELI
ncbi:hypothetical protein AHAS_Ahas16G0208400 [Arachis hypogaea]